MAETVPDTIEKTKYADTSVNKPASGTYGEKAALDRLKAQLPSSGVGNQPGGGGAGPTPMQGPGVGPPQSGPGRPPSGMTPPGVPDVLGHPTDRPQVPMGTRLAAKRESPMSQAESDRDARIALLLALKDSPDVSEATREWAALVLDMVT